MHIRYLLSFLFSFGAAISSANEIDPFGKVYTQCFPTECFEKGVASYHFDSPDKVWINWKKFNFGIARAFKRLQGGDQREPYS